jgi:hypothetical protein
MAYKPPESQNLHPHNDHEGTAERCPTCGQTFPDSRLCAPFVPATSGLLDLVVVIRDAAAELQAALEDEVLL